MFKEIQKGKAQALKIEKISIATLMQTLQYNLRCPAAKDNSMYCIRMQPRQQATLLQPLQRDIEILKCKTQ